MERSRSKRNYHYDQDYDSQPPARTKPRYHHNHHRRSGGGAGGRKPHDPSPAAPTVTTSFRILCPDVKAGGVIGKSGSIIKAFRQETGAWINVHPPINGDAERIIEISDVRRRNPDGRVPYSPAQEALLMIHDRILESDVDAGFGYDGGDDDEDYPVGRGGPRVATRLVVPRTQVGCLLGKGGKIIEQMRIETKTQIRILPRDHKLPRCVSMSEEIVQVVGDSNAVRKAIEIISSRLKESQHRDRVTFHGRLQSPERFFPPDDDFTPHMNNMPRRSVLDGPNMGPRSSAGLSSVRSNSYASRPSGYAFESAAAPMADHAQSFYYEDLVFRILCPNNKVENVMGESDGIMDILRDEVGVDVRVTDPVPGSDERIIVISSEEGPDDELFPAQEALLHIQSQIVDLDPEKENIVTTRLLVPSTEIGCLEGCDGSLSEMRTLTRANIQILPREELPPCALEADDLVQIVGEIRAARDALVQVTLKLRSYLYRDILFPKDSIPSSVSTPGNLGSVFGLEAGSPNRNLAREIYQGSDPPSAGHQNMQTATAGRQSKDTTGGASVQLEQEESDVHEEGPSGMNRSQALPVATKKTLEVTIPEHAIPSLIKRSGNKLAQISEMSGATVTLLEEKSDQPERVIQITGSPEKAEKAQSLLQGFILSIQEDAPSN